MNISQKRATMQYNVSSSYRNKPKHFLVTADQAGYDIVFSTATWLSSYSINTLLNNIDEGNWVRVTVYDYLDYSGRGNMPINRIMFKMRRDSYAEQLAESFKKHRAPRDFQRSRVYELERAWFDDINYRQSEKEIQDTLEIVCGFLGMEENLPTIEVSNRKKTYSTCYGGSHIKLAAGWGQGAKVVLHELAHAIDARLIDDDGVGHGAQFVAVSLALYNNFLGNWKPVDPYTYINKIGKRIAFCEDTYDRVCGVINGDIQPCDVFKNGVSTARRDTLLGG